MNLRHTMRLFTLLFSAAVLGLSGPGGCGSAGNCDTFAADYCARIAECEPSTYAYLSGGDDGICQARLRPSCTQGSSISDSLLTPEKAGECGKALRASTCDDLLSGRVPEVCVPPGPRADGASCSDSLQCASTRCTGSATTCGTCAPRLKAGDACQSSSQCQAGLRCRNSGTSTGTCTAYVALGQPCTSLDICLPSLFCNNNGTANGTCAARRNVGETCTNNADCDSQKKLACDPTSKKCAVYTISYVDLGGACPNSTSVNYNVCKGDAHCASKTSTGGGTSSTCVAGVLAGQPCNNLDLACGAGLVCTDKVCQISPTPIACK